MPTISVDWSRSPRIITVLAPDTSITIQELHNLCRDAEQELENLDDPFLISSSGKVNLVGGAQTGIVSTLNDAKLAFQARTLSVESGTATSSDPTGVMLYDTSALFVTNGVEVGAHVFNLDDGSSGTVVKVWSEIQLEMLPLDDGSTNQWTIGDAYKVWNVVACVVSGGDLAAVDNLGAQIDPIHPTAFTQVTVAAATAVAFAQAAELALIPGIDAKTDVLPTLAADTADAVWDEQTIDHVEMGTFGGEIATKADVKAAAMVDEVTATAGTLIQGTNISGSYTDTKIRNGVYWTLAEDVTNGLTVEMSFALPSVEHRAGSISVFGYYMGVPSTTHYMELWAYNYEALAWELLQEVFMPGGNTSSSEYKHEYGERHIKRDGSNEVKIRLIHNTTTYIATHRLYLDLVEVSGISVVTAASIADAVWDEALSGHAIAGSSGQTVTKIDKTVAPLPGLL